MDKIYQLVEYMDDPELNADDMRQLAMRANPCNLTLRGAMERANRFANEVRNDLEEEKPIALEWCKLPTDEGEPARWWSKDPALHINYEVVELTVGE